MLGIGNPCQYRRAAWPQPPVHPRQYFCSTAAPANDGSELACRRDRQLRAQLSPCPLKKPNLAESWGGWRWHRACRGVSVRRRGDTTLHCPHPFRPFCSALRFAVVYISRTHPHPARLPTALPISPSCDHSQIGQSSGQSARHHPSELRPGCLSHQSIIAEMYLILPAPMPWKVCHVSVREDQRPTARLPADPSSEKTADSL